MLSQRDRLRERIRAECLRQIKRLNARFRKLKKRDGPMFDQMATRKEELIDVMQASCPHYQKIQCINKCHLSERMCSACGFIAWRTQVNVPLNGSFGKLDFTGTMILDDDDYLFKRNKLLKKLGIDL